MGAYAKNKAILGDYQGADVVSLLGEVSISNCPGGSLFLSLGTVESFEIITGEHIKNASLGGSFGLESGALRDFVKTLSTEAELIRYVALQFKDGKKSLLEVDRDICVALIKNCLDQAVARCGVTPEKVKSCDPHNEAACRDCPCFACVVWPNCCYRRIYGRRAKYRNNSA